MSAGVGIINGTVSDLDTDAPSFPLIITCIVIYGVMIGIGLIAVALFAAAQISGRKTFAQFPFFKIVRHLTIANGLFLFIQAVNIFPSMLIDTEDTPDWLNDLWGTVGDVVTELGDQAVLYFTFLMGVNRLLVFAAPRALWLFQGHSLRIILLCTWLLVGGTTAIRLTGGNPKKFNRKTLTFNALILEPNTTWAYQVTTLAGYIIPLLLILLYIVIFIFLRKKRQSAQSARLLLFFVSFLNLANQFPRCEKSITNQRESMRNRETGRIKSSTRSRQVTSASADESPPQRDTSNDDIQILIQALIVSVSLEITRLISTIAPMMRFDDNTKWIVNILASVSSVANQALNPLIFVCTNKMVRRALRRIPKSIMGQNSSTNSLAKP
ncbi:hypothetical protein PRIPAC_89469 [Pristionchus pacificus]|uniref:G protein-coupled receptor n=1 Tax=Pristionchus pacificus TaxID=54126 RepID=A0A2A6CWX0_PRIPA|nr:hypothetical protein PRIPAC_89469 [Pristionchus pacificus]|eukprot:PDM82675.1 G protein-coupled receptor [Pristionchus pacificus]